MTTTSFWQWHRASVLCLIAAVSCLPNAILAAPSTPPTPSMQPMSFATAAQQVMQQSNALAGANARTQAAGAEADALKGLRWPAVSLDAQQLRYQKTFNISLRDLNNSADASAKAVLHDIQGNGVATVSSADVSAVLNQVRQALPGVFPSISGNVGFRSQQDVFHPTLTALMPIYSGGAIVASQKAAKSGQAVAEFS